MSTKKWSRAQQQHQSQRRSSAAVPDGAEVRALLIPVVDASQAYLEEVSVKRAGGRCVVRVTVDLPENSVGSMTLDAVSELSRDVAAALDASEVIAGAYTLEVSTPGTDRPLTEVRHFKRARTRLVRLILRDGSTRRGRLQDVREGSSGGLLVFEDGRQTALETVMRGAVEVELSGSGSDEDGRLDDEPGPAIKPPPPSPAHGRGDAHRQDG